MSAWFGTSSAGSQQADLRHACKLGLEGIVSRRKDSPYRGRSADWLKNPEAPAVKREREEDGVKREWR